MNKYSRLNLSRFTQTASLLLLLGTTSCGARSTDATDTKTNWLSSCDEDAECGGEFSCLCGVCTTSCDGSGECQELGSGARCIDAPECGGATAVCARKASDLDPPPSTDEPTSTTSTSSSTATNETTSESDETDAVETSSSTTSTDSSESDATSDDSGVTTDCREPEAYTALGAECQVVDFACEGPTRYFADDCGCGCEPNPQCDPDSNYAAYGQACEELAVDCAPAYEAFTDECGCGCNPIEGCNAEASYEAFGQACLTWECSGTQSPTVDSCGCYCEGEALPPECEDASRNYYSYDVAMCAPIPFTCPGEGAVFSDECGCGCEDSVPYVCPAAPDGTLVETNVLATLACTEGIFQGLLGSQQELADALASCTTEVPTVDFNDGAVALLTFGDRPSATLREVVLDAGAVYYTLESSVYCGGAAPPSTVLVVQLAGVSPSTELKLNALCTLGECSGPPAP